MKVGDRKEDSMTERTYNAVEISTAKKMAATLRRQGYKVRRRLQWVYVQANGLDMLVSQIARRYRAIAY